MTEQERTSRGYMIQSTLEYMEEAYEPAVREKLIEAMPPRIRAMLVNVNKVGWYPVDDIREIFRPIAAYHHETDGKEVEALEKVGRAIAKTATTTFLKLVLKVLTPSLFAAKLGDFWARDNRCGRLTCVSHDSAGKRLVVRIDGVKGYDFIGAVAPGFLLNALDGLGFKNTRATFDFSFDDPGPETLTYVFSWD